MASSLTLAAGCAHDVVRQPATLMAPAASPVIEIQQDVEIVLDSGYARRLARGSRWAQAGTLAQGDAYKAVGGVFTVEGAHVHEAWPEIIGDRPDFSCCTRYIELNPVRAGMVAHPRDYRWSSYLAHADGARDHLLADHRLYRRLGKDGASRQSAYRQLFRGALGEALLAEIRDATNKGWALGDDRFRRQIEALGDRRAAPRKAGRPPNK